MSIVELPS
ncbi:hypothetical protein YPPY32_0654, partial [Yersinia pestis PY-32]